MEDNIFAINNNIYSNNNNILLEIIQKLNNVIDDLNDSNINKIIINKIKDIIIIINKLINENKKNVDLIRKDIKNLDAKIDKNFKELKDNNKRYYNLLIEKKSEVNRNNDNLSKFNEIFGTAISNKSIKRLNLKENINVKPSSIKFLNLIESHELIELDLNNNNLTDVSSIKDVNLIQLKKLSVIFFCPKTEIVPKLVCSVPKLENLSQTFYFL